MTTTELKEAYEKTKTLPRIPSEKWKVLFDFYNSNSGKFKISMGCRPCYDKVLSFVWKYLEEQKISS